MQVYNEAKKVIIVMTNNDPPKCPVLTVSATRKAVLRDDYKGKVSTKKGLLAKLCSL